jgi:hypothetical protein
VLEYLCTDNPIIVIDQKNKPDYYKTDNGRSGGRVFDACSKTPIGNLVNTVKQQLENPDEYRDQRNYWKDWVVGKVDGKSSYRIADFMESVV